MRVTSLLTLAILLWPLLVSAKDLSEAKRINRMVPVEDISALVFPKVNGQLPVFTHTDKIQLGYLDILVVQHRGAENASMLHGDKAHPLHRSVILAEGVPYFRIEWQIPNVKRIALFNLDATRAGYRCCQTSSMETESCFDLPSLIASFNFDISKNTVHRVFQARHAFASFDNKSVVTSRLLVRVQTVDGKYFEREIKLYYRSNSIHNSCS